MIAKMKKIRCQDRFKGIYTCIAYTFEIFTATSKAIISALLGDSTLSSQPLLHLLCSVNDVEPEDILVAQEEESVGTSQFGVTAVL